MVSPASFFSSSCTRIMRLPSPTRRFLPSTLLAALLLAFPTPGDAQVIRSYESLDRDAGEAWYLTFGLELDGKDGNTEEIELDVSGAVGWRGTRHWLRLYPAYTWRRTDGEVREFARSAHLRHSYTLGERTSTFAFLQAQADPALELERRFLVGGGLRRRLVEFDQGRGFDLGVGVMWEEERVEGRPPEEIFRGSNLVAVQTTAGEVAVTLTGFFQPRLDDWGDHRVSASASAGVPLATGWNLALALGWLRDSRPPAEVEKDDVNFTVGVRFAVR